MFDQFYKDKKVLVTGHTGFKGSWLSQWLLMLGAEPYGYSLEPETESSLFRQLGLDKQMSYQIDDIRDRQAIERAIIEQQPDVVFHLAAQPIVRLSYRQPESTYETNVMGTVNLLGALRRLNKPCSVVVITSDKCYENKEWLFGYREGDRLGGHDPYSSSKACVEIAVESFRQSFFRSHLNHYISLATARAGNVIGGGDWALDRIVPDSIRALSRGDAICVRNPRATRPWQHVLEPLSGYLLLAQHIYPGQEDVADHKCSAYNFGPSVDSNIDVETLVERILTHWPGTWEDVSDPNAPHEAHLLHLNTDKAWHCLRWRPVWDFETTVTNTVKWYRDVIESELNPEQTRELTQKQILSYCKHAQDQGQIWVCDEKIGEAIDA